MLAEHGFFLSASSRAINSSAVKNVVVGDYTCVNRSSFGKNINIGMFSYIVDADVGNYCAFGSRISVGGYEHPIDTLTIHEFSYRNLAPPYDETLFPSDHKHTRGKLTSIGSDVWIGNNACIKAGVTIGIGAVVGQGAVVTKNIEPYAIVAGNPARIIKYRFPKSKRIAMLQSRWWELDISEMSDLDFKNIPECLEKVKKIHQRRHR